MSKKALSVPRELSAIQAEYQQLALNAGQIQYTIKVNQDELNSLNERLLKLNHEAAARKQLDESKNPEKVG